MSVCLLCVCLSVCLLCVGCVLGVFACLSVCCVLVVWPGAVQVLHAVSCPAAAAGAGRFSARDFGALAGCTRALYAQIGPALLCAAAARDKWPPPETSSRQQRQVAANRELAAANRDK